MRFIFWLILLSSPLLATSVVKIDSVLPNGVFRLHNGETVALANVQFPGAQPADSIYQMLKKYSLTYARSHFTGRPVRVEYSGKTSTAGYALAHLIIPYPLEKFNINRLYLEKGFGRYTDNADSAYRAVYQQAEADARLKKRGVWNPKQPLYTGQPDYLLSVHYGYAAGKHEDHDIAYHGVHLRIAPFKTVSGLEAGLTLYRIVERGFLCCECDYWEGYQPVVTTEISTGAYAYAQYNQNWHYGGFSVGLNWIYLGDMYCTEAPDMVVFPKLGGRVGWLDKLYLSLDAFDVSSFSFLPLSLTYVFSDAGDRVTVSGSALANRLTLSAQLRMTIRQNWAMVISAAYQNVTYNGYEAAKNQFGVQMGIGYLFK